MDLSAGFSRDEWCQPMADADRASENQASRASGPWLEVVATQHREKTRLLFPVSHSAELACP